MPQDRQAQALRGLQNADPFAQAEERAKINQTLGQLAPPSVPTQAEPINTAPFTFANPEQIPDISSLVEAMKRSGLRGSRTQDVGLSTPISELLKRAQDIPTGY
mgnify:CR=1 FL=1